MPRRKSLIAQMCEAHQKAKLQRQREDERLRRECGRTVVKVDVVRTEPVKGAPRPRRGRGW